MSQFHKYKTINTKSISMILFFMLFANFSVIAQSKESLISIDNFEKISVGESVEAPSVSSNMNFVLWFMGSKQDPNTAISSDKTNAKKQIITSGMAPNRLLIKAFLKKAVDFKSSLA
ncbi:MAG: hypothetical protein PHW29_10740 [Flavobacterium sp.]|jgi:hypothetical protein|nr:hypothetical protein [uncultured Flavobacterium sp.]MDD2821728.1 hypothetical protein [Flavobacterium sp.]